MDPRQRPGTAAGDARAMSLISRIANERRASLSRVDQLNKVVSTLPRYESFTMGITAPKPVTSRPTSASKQRAGGPTPLAATRGARAPSPSGQRPVPVETQPVPVPPPPMSRSASAPRPATAGPASTTARGAPGQTTPAKGQIHFKSIQFPSQFGVQTARSGSAYGTPQQQQALSGPVTGPGAQTISSQQQSGLAATTLSQPASMQMRALFGDSRAAMMSAASTMPSAGTPVVVRSDDEKRANPERLNLDRRKLTICPVLEGEHKLRLLNYQNNAITEIANLTNLPELIFLDFYNNQIRRISGLEHVVTLRVLMLGKNNIVAIENLQLLNRLDVLDLHSNRIDVIENLQHLRELRVLNLAGNNIAVVDNLVGLDALTELNLRRNKIERIVGLDLLPSLQRVFLSNNNIRDFECIDCLFRTKNLMELALDGNPIADQTHYRSQIIQRIKTLRHLDMKRITDEERRTSMLIVRQEEQRQQERRKQEVATEGRSESVRAVQREWNDADDESTTDAAPVSAGPAAMNQTSGSVALGMSGALSPEDAAAVRRRGHWEIDGETLYVYGSVVDALDTKSNMMLPSVSFQYVDVEKVVAALPKLKRMPNFSTLSFAHNGITALNQLNRLGSLKGLQSLTIQNNPITSSVMFRPYCIFKLHSLRRLNGVEVTSEERDAAEAQFAGLHRIFARATPHLDPHSLPRMSHTVTEQAVEAFTVVTSSRCMFAHDADPIAQAYVGAVVQHALSIDEKIAALNSEWPAIIAKYVKSALAQMMDMDTYMHNCLDDV
eukprot:TRINITY_DN9076_c0_g1_i1.p1 TRINITY_DN9076_c0_g1~~TRINITY_DN9076_c0_g1_i1.p1  ORF type:complete len:780 (-),score=174.04 TRINITY_DN9076_c0_g1_i1:157-2496(-)